jgi:hypothetical protein
MPVDNQNGIEQILLELAERELQSLREPYDEMRDRILKLESYINKRKGGSQLPLPKTQRAKVLSAPRRLFGKEMSPEEELDLVLREERAEEILRKEGKPMKLPAIFKEFGKNEWPISGKQPKENLRQTLIKRKEKFRNLGQGGFELIQK